MRIIERVRTETKATRKKRSDRRATEDADDFHGEPEDEGVQTPKKRRKTYSATTPRKQDPTVKLMTPSHKR